MLHEGKEALDKYFFNEFILWYSQKMWYEISRCGFKSQPYHLCLEAQGPQQAREPQGETASWGDREVTNIVLFLLMANPEI